jgi:hypothetical protein
VLALDAATFRNKDHKCEDSWKCESYSAACYTHVASSDAPTREEYVSLKDKVYHSDYLPKLEQAKGFSLCGRFRRAWADPNAVVTFPITLTAPGKPRSSSGSGSGRRLSSTLSWWQDGYSTDELPFQAWVEMPRGADLRVRMTYYYTVSGKAQQAEAALSVPECPPGTWITLALTMRGNQAQLYVSCDSNAQSYHVTAAMPDKLWQSIPSKPWVLLGATGEGQYQEPSKCSVQRSTNGGDLGGFAMYGSELTGLDVSHALGRLSVCEQQKGYSHLCSDAHDDGASRSGPCKLRSCACTGWCVLVFRG